MSRSLAGLNATRGRSVGVPNLNGLGLSGCLELQLQRVDHRSSIRKRLSTLGSFGGERAGFVGARDGSTLKWKTAAERTDQWASVFNIHSVVGIRLNDPIAFCREYLAALSAGICIAPLDPRCTSDELSDLSEILGITDIVTDEVGESQSYPDLRGIWISSPHGLQQRHSTEMLRSVPTFASVLLTTSGTTGRPKVVPLSERQLLRVATEVALHHSLTPDDRGYSPLPLCHVNAQVVGVLSTLVSGATLVVDDRFHRSDFWEVVQRYKPTWLNLVPAILGVLGTETVDCQQSVLDNIRFARSASAPLANATRERFESGTGIGVLETYGMTEAASQIAANPTRATERRPGSVGIPLGVLLRIVDDEGNVLPNGMSGHVEISGPNVIDSYLTSDNQVVPARNPEGWLHTGDLGRTDDDDYVYLEGRADDVINRGGEKIQPGEIENVLLRDSRVLCAAVIGRPHPILGSEVVACVEARNLAESDPQTLTAELLADCRRRLSRHKWPAEVLLVDHMPTGPTGKLLRRQLRDYVADPRSTDRDGN